MPRVFHERIDVVKPAQEPARLLGLLERFDSRIELGERVRVIAENPFQHAAIAVVLPLRGIRAAGALAAVLAEPVLHVDFPMTEGVIADQIAREHPAHAIELHLSGHSLCQ